MNNENYYFMLTKKRTEALSNGDAPNYFKYCNEAGIRREDIEDIFLYDVGQTDAELKTGSKNLEKVLKEKNQDPKKKELVKMANELGLKIGDIFADTDKKRRLLKEIMGYSSLKGNGGTVSIEACSPAKIGKAFRNTYNSK